MPRLGLLTAYVCAAMMHARLCGLSTSFVIRPILRAAVVDDGPAPSESSSDTMFHVSDDTEASTDSASSVEELVASMKTPFVQSVLTGVPSNTLNFVYSASKVC